MTIIHKCPYCHREYPIVTCESTAFCGQNKEERAKQKEEFTQEIFDILGGVPNVPVIAISLVIERYFQ